MTISGIENRIRKVILEQCGGSNQAFADTIKINVSTIQKWKGENFPKGDILSRIRKEFNVDINWLLTGQGETYIKDRKPVPVSTPQLEDKDGLWGEGREVTVGGKKVPLTLFSPAGQAGLPSEYNKPAGIGHAVDLLANILSSGDQIIVTAIMSNLRAFSDAVDSRRQAEERISKLEDECAVYEKRITALEDRHKDDPPDHDHKSPRKKAI